jgi:hypothetical protein
LLIALIAGALAVAVVRGAYVFLSVEDPAPGGILVAEGWAPDYVLAEVVAEFRRNHYDAIFVTGIPLEQGTPLSEYKTFAELGAAVLIRLGADPRIVHAIPSPPVTQDRTYASALALRAGIRERGLAMDKVNIFSLGAHSRRTRMLYEKAFGPSTRVGVVAVRHRDFEPDRWWRTSQGFRIITAEFIAYFYARCLFHPEPPVAL